LRLQWNTVVHRGISWHDLENEERRLIQKVKHDPDQGYFLICEPTPTFTYGKSASPDDLLWSKTELARRGLEIIAADRGGKWTYHGPGQIVLFPIFDLAQGGYARTEIRRLVTGLRELTESFLDDLGISVDRRETPFGLYVENQKLVSFGIAVHQGIASHGLALYYDGPDLSFLGIRSCGVTDERFTSLTQLGKASGWEPTALELARRLQKLTA